MESKKRKSRRTNTKFSVKLQLENIEWDKIEKIFFADRKLIQLKLEREEKRIARIKEILTLLAGGAVLGLSLVIPAAPMALAPFIIDRKKYDQSTFNRAIDRLEKQKLVEIVYNGDQTLVKITHEGRVRALRYKLSEVQVKRPKAWDKKWRIVIFDIPEKYKRTREIFRNHLKTMGFYMLQDSVWVHPYPCFDEMEFLRQIYKVSVDVTYIVAEKIEGVEDLKSQFHL